MKRSIDNNDINCNTSKRSKKSGTGSSGTNWLQINFTNKNNNKNNHTITIAETLIDTTQTNTTGLHVWSSALQLAPLLIEYGQQGILHGKHIVELGCGTGVLGCVASISEFQAARIDMTDNDASVLQALHDNFQVMFPDHIQGTSDGNESNTGSKISSNGSKVHISKLEWGNFINHSDLKKFMGADIVIGADCLYDRTQWDSFFATVYFLLSSSRDDTNTDKTNTTRNTKINSNNNNNTADVAALSQRRFIGCHELRNSNHTIKPYLDKWGLVASVLQPSTQIQTDCFELSETLGLFQLVLKQKNKDEEN
tara:strand:+ start:67 stop:996 length:930 start_codon:yes stop_codon:yes gene_type:complete